MRFKGLIKHVRVTVGCKGKFTRDTESKDNVRVGVHQGMSFDEAKLHLLV